MTNFFKSTISSLFQSALGNSQVNRRSSSNYRQTKHVDDDEEDDFINRKLEIREYKLVVKKKIGCGGFSTVYQAMRQTDNTVFAIKRMHVEDQDQRDRVIKESRIWCLCNGPSIVKFIFCAKLSETKYGSSEYILLSEYCDHGQLSDFMGNSRKFDSSQAFQILYQQTCALNHIHSLNPAIVHRDIKLENFLLATEGNRIILKLCDFGSATDEQLQPNSEWTALYRGLVEDEFHTATTPAYRPPELLNTYDEGLIGCPMDMWALGCCFYQEALSLSHPFLDCSKLKIINADYKISSKWDVKILEIIQKLLVPHPSRRISANNLLNLMYSEALIPEDAVDCVNLKFVLSPPHPQVQSQDILHLTSRLSLLTSASQPVKQSECYVIDEIPLCVVWFGNVLPDIITNVLSINSTNSVLLYSQIFGRTVVAAASIFFHCKLCRQSEHFLRYLSKTIGNQSSLQIELPASARRYMDYVFDKPINHKTMMIKQLEILPGNEPFSTMLFQIDSITGNEHLISQSDSSCEWQRNIGCGVYGDILIKISTSNREAELRVNTMFIPLTESEISFEGCDLDSHPFGDNWIESITLEFMFMTDDLEDISLDSKIDPFLIIKDERELKSINLSLETAAPEHSKFFFNPVPCNQRTDCRESTTDNRKQSVKSDLLAELSIDDYSPLIDLSESNRSSTTTSEIPESLFTNYWNPPIIDETIPAREPLNPHRVLPEKSKSSSDPIHDLFGIKSDRPKITLKEMQKLKLQQEASEPENFRAVKKWSKDNHHSIALLLSQLHLVLPAHQQWSPVSLSTDRSTFSEVKKCYRKAILLVHPDKNNAKSLPPDQHELCRLIFIELSEAWGKFQDEHS